MLNQQIIRELFKISADENIFDDYQCTHDMKPGKLYICENHLCFYSDFMGETKLIFEFTNIESLIKTKSAVEVKVASKVYKFSGFADIQLAYQYIRTSWIGCCPDKDTPENAPQNEPETTGTTPPPSKDGLQPMANNKSTESKTKINSAKNSKEKSVKSLEQKVQEEEKKEGNNNENNGPAVVFFEMDDPSMLQKSLERYPKKPDECMRVVLAYSVDEYMKRFVNQGCIFPDTKLLETMGSKNFVDKGWSTVEGKPEIKKHIMELEYKLSNSLFVSSAFTIKEITITPNWYISL